jgi:ribosomal protein S12 methylthiotransferase
MYPDLMDETMIHQLANIEKFVPYFDIPIQHTQDKLLSDMKRRGNSQQIIDICNVIRDTFEFVVIRTTLIVGYPSETQEDFDAMCQFIVDYPFDRLGAFTFSKEEDTFANSLEDLPESIKQERYQQIMATQSQITPILNQKIVHTKIVVVVEKVDTITKTAKCRSKFHAPDDIDGYVYVSLTSPVNAGDFIHCTVDDFNRLNWYATQVEELDEK